MPDWRRIDAGFDRDGATMSRHDNSPRAVAELAVASLASRYVVESDLF
jgi:hypothetical protein